VRGVYKWRDGVLTALADTAPGGAPDILAVEGSPRISGDTTVFHYGAAVFSVTDGGSLQTVADRSITPPSSDRNFARFFHAAVSGAQTIYSADVGTIGAGSADGIYSGVPGGAGATLIAGKSTPAPGVDGETFKFFGPVPSVSDSAIAFRGASSLGWGIYSAETDGSNPEVVADPATPVPGFGSSFGSQISAIPSLSGDTVAFAAAGYGVYTRSRGQDIRIVADRNTSPTGSGDTFGSFSGMVAISGNTVAFGASGFGGDDVPNGIYISSPCGGLELLVREQDTIEGELVSRLRFSNAALDGGMIVFSARTSGGTLALFLAERIPILLSRQTAGDTNSCIQIREDQVLGCLMDDGRSYNPDFWNDGGPIQNNNNCYAYAMNKATGTYPQPGVGAGLPYIDPETGVTCAGISERAEADRLSPADCGIPCPDGSRKVALAVYPGGSILGGDKDYHWYREHSDGTWSHKPGPKTARNVDASGKIINDITTADLDHSISIGDVTIFRKYELCSCFCTRPDCSETIR
jgi:hypothetical protein